MAAQLTIGRGRILADAVKDLRRGGNCLRTTNRERYPGAECLCFPSPFSWRRLGRAADSRFSISNRRQHHTILYDIYCMMLSVNVDGGANPCSGRRCHGSPLWADNQDMPLSPVWAARSAVLLSVETVIAPPKFAAISLPFQANRPCSQAVTPQRCAKLESTPEIARQNACKSPAADPGIHRGSCFGWNPGAGRNYRECCWMDSRSDASRTLCAHKWALKPCFYVLSIVSAIPRFNESLSRKQD